MVNEDTLLRTHCCPRCFLGCANWETFVADTKFVSATMLRARANGETFVSATMCLQQCVLVCQGLNRNQMEETESTEEGVSCYVSVKSKLQHPPPGIPRAFVFFGKFLLKFPPPEAEKLFKCLIIGPFQVIKCPHPRAKFPDYF